jgi:hypothetical protein
MSVESQFNIFKSVGPVGIRFPVLNFSRNVWSAKGQCFFRSKDAYPGTFIACSISVDDIVATDAAAVHRQFTVHSPDRL